MNPTDILTLIAAIGGLAGVGSIITALVQRGRGKAQSETEARAQNTNEFNAIVAANKEQLARMQEQLDAADRKARAQDEKITAMDRKISEVRDQHQSAEDYIDLLMAGIYNGTIPPIPPRA